MSQEVVERHPEFPILMLSSQRFPHLGVDCVPVWAVVIPLPGPLHLSPGIPDADQLLQASSAFHLLGTGHRVRVPLHQLLERDGLRVRSAGDIDGAAQERAFLQSLLDDPEQVGRAFLNSYHSAMPPVKSSKPSVVAPPKVLHNTH